MTKSTKAEVGKCYRATLQRHLERRLSPDSAARIGGAAASLEFGSVELVRLHNQFIGELLQSSQVSSKQDCREHLTRAGAFLEKALAPISKSATERIRKLNKTGIEDRKKLAKMRRALSREIARHTICKRKLAQSTRHYSHLLVQSHRMQDQLRLLARQILSAQEDERKEISRELHDEVTQLLAGINVELASLNEAAALDTRSLRKRIAQTQRLVEQTVNVVHRYARDLRPALLDDLGLIPALRSYIRDLPARNGLRVQFSAFPGVEAMSNTQRTVLYRVTQEALTNVTRHAHAQLASVRIQKIPNAVRLEIHDDGRSFAADRLLSASTMTRLGLLGMRERVEMVGGHFSIESAPGKGTTICADIPFRSHDRSKHS
ncbi:MAG: sensor histidine kinase [Nibricoccus sp.]